MQPPAGTPTPLRLRTERAAGVPDDDAGRLVVVSNRVPMPAKSGASSAGGLAVALEGALRRRGGLWFGWSGRTCEREADCETPATRQAGPITFAVTDLTKREFDEYYLGFANRVLWPICHYRLDLVQPDRRHLDTYFKVNDRFARALAPMIRPDDTVWVQDYHFIPFAAALKAAGATNRIGFFLHIPWPPSDIASALPVYERLLRAFTAYDLIGFHTPQDVENFIGCLVRERIGRRLADDQVEVEGRIIRIGAFPVGIDTRGFRNMAKRAERSPLVERMRQSLNDRKLIIGVDRSDYSKGIRQRIEAFSCLLRCHPETRNRVTFLQITPKSRSEVPEYRRMQQEIAEQAGTANGAHGEVDWVPIRYVTKTMGHAQLAGLYRAARVGLVTPLRDGMNLVAKEYVAAQPRQDPGVLVLSRFAGAAHELGDGAVLVNPYDIEATADAIAEALAMPLDERKARWNAMMERLEANTIDHWCETSLQALAEDAPDPYAVDLEHRAPRGGTLAIKRLAHLS